MKVSHGVPLICTTFAFINQFKKIKKLNLASHWGCGQLPHSQLDSIYILNSVE